MFKVPEQFRLVDINEATETDNNGFFIIKSPVLEHRLYVKATEGDGEESVTVVLPNQVATWEEMHTIKNLFWDESDMVVHMQRPKSLHLFRKIGVKDFAKNYPKRLVGYRM